jgi:hypothetical protein
MKNIAQQKIPNEMLRFLENTDKNWMPHITTIFYLFDPKAQCVYFITTPNSKKYRNLMRYPKISLTIDRRDSKNPFNNEGILVRGTTIPIYHFWSPELKLTLKAIENDQKFLTRYITREDYEESERSMILRVLSLFQKKYPQFLSTPGRDVEVVTGSLERVMVQLNIASISYWRGPKFKKFKMA